MDEQRFDRFKKFLDMRCCKGPGVSLQHLYEAFQMEQGEDEVTKEEFMALVRKWNPSNVWNVKERPPDDPLDLVGGYIGGLCLYEHKTVLERAMEKLCLWADNPMESYRGAMGREPLCIDFVKAAEDRACRKRDERVQFGLLLEVYKWAYKERHHANLNAAGEKRMRFHYNWFMQQAQAEGPKQYARELSIMWGDIARMYSEPFHCGE